MDPGEDVGPLEGADGTRWQATGGRGLLTGLESKLGDIKALCMRAFGLDMDEDEYEGSLEDAGWHQLAG